MRKKKKTAISICVALALLLIGGTVIFVFDKEAVTKVLLHTELDDAQHCSMQARAVKALEVARRWGLSENYCIFVDYGKRSGKKRLFVWNLRTGKIEAGCHVMHGNGMGSTAEKPVFSDKPGSNCSTLGMFIITGDHGNKIKRSYRLKGLDPSNRNAYNRGIMLHSSSWVDQNAWRKYIPLHPASCKGCVTVSRLGMNYLESLIESENKRILLWSYCESDQ